MSILTTIKQRPENQKKIISLVTAVILTFIIVIVWFSFSGKSINGQLAEEGDNKLSSVSPMQVIKDEFSKVFSGFNDAVTEIESSSTVPVEIISSDLIISTSSVSSSTEENIASGTVDQIN